MNPKKYMDYEQKGYAAGDKDAEIRDLKNHVCFAWGFAIFILLIALFG